MSLHPPPTPLPPKRARPCSPFEPIKSLTLGTTPPSPCTQQPRHPAPPHLTVKCEMWGHPGGVVPPKKNRPKLSSAQDLVTTPSEALTPALEDSHQPTEPFPCSVWPHLPYTRRPTHLAQTHGVTPLPPLVTWWRRDSWK